MIQAKPHLLNTSSRRETMTGFVVPLHWDNDKVTSVIIACEGERDVIVEGLSDCPGLLGLLQKKAIVTGDVTIVQGIERIRVETVKPHPDNLDRG